MSKISEAFAAKQAEGAQLLQRADSEGWSDEIRSASDAVAAELAGLSADLKREQGMHSHVAQVNSLVVPAKTQGLTRHSEVSFADVLRFHAENAVSANGGTIERALVDSGDIASTQEQVVGNFVDFTRAKTPIANSMTNLPMFQGASVQRQYFSNVSGASAGVQAVEGNTFTELGFATSKKQVVKYTIGAFVPLSVQSIEFSDPSAYALAQIELERALAKTIELKSAAALVAANSHTATLALNANGQAVYTALIAAGAQLLDQSGRDPEVIFMGTAKFQALATLFASDGRPLFPSVGPNNALGTSSLWQNLSLPNAKVVVSPSLPANFMSVASSELMEWYFQSRGIKTNPENVRNGTVDVGISGYYAVNVWDAAQVVLQP